MKSISSLPFLKKGRIRSLRALVEDGLIAEEVVESLESVVETLPLALTPHLLKLMDPADPDDPIARQFIPDAREKDISPEERLDPIGDGAHSPVKGIVHRYPDRVLLVPLLQCAAHCRFCFRRDRLSDEGSLLSEEELERAFDYIRTRPGIWEVILTGGDPLLLSPRRLSFILERLDAIAHIGLIRIHTRLPVTDPLRLTSRHRAVFRKTRCPVYIAVHVNHAREFGVETRDICAQLSQTGIPLLGQTVLLRGINDSLPAMEDLLRTMVRNRIKPYYLHHADLARGTSHFRTTIEEGQALMKALRGRISGHCLPSYVVDIPGGGGKSPLVPSYWNEEEKIVENWKGEKHPYP